MDIDRFNAQPYAYRYAYYACADVATLGMRDWETIAADFASRHKEAADKVRAAGGYVDPIDEWYAYLRDIGGTVNLPSYVSALYAGQEYRRVNMPTAYSFTAGTIFVHYGRPF